MAKKKQIKHLSKKKINNKLFFGIVSIFLLLFVLVVFAYSIPSVGIPIENNIQTNYQNLFSNWTNPTPPKTHIPSHPLGPNIFIYPTKTPIPFVITTYPNILKVSRQANTNSHISALQLTITSNKTVRNLYNDIYDSKFFIPEEMRLSNGSVIAVPIHCPASYGKAEYSLNFYLNNIIITKGTYTIEGCQFINMGNDHGQTRWPNSAFEADFQQATGLSGQSLYGYL